MNELAKLLRGFDGNVRSVKTSMTVKINKLLKELPSLTGKDLIKAQKEVHDLQIRRRKLNAFQPTDRRPSPYRNRTGSEGQG